MRMAPGRAALGKGEGGPGSGLGVTPYCSGVGPGQPAVTPLPPPPLPPLQLTMNDFSVHRIIGRGGFGEVYGCRKADTGKM